MANEKKGFASFLESGLKVATGGAVKVDLDGDGDGVNLGGIFGRRRKKIRKMKKKKRQMKKQQQAQQSNNITAVGGATRDGQQSGLGAVLSADYLGIGIPTVPLAVGVMAVTGTGLFAKKTVRRYRRRKTTRRSYRRRR